MSLDTDKEKPGVSRAENEALDCRPFSLGTRLLPADLKLSPGLSAGRFLSESNKQRRNSSPGFLPRGVRTVHTAGRVSIILGDCGYAEEK